MSLKRVCDECGKTLGTKIPFVLDVDVSTFSKSKTVDICNILCLIIYVDKLKDILIKESK